MLWLDKKSEIRKRKWKAAKFLGGILLAAALTSCGFEPMAAASAAADKNHSLLPVALEPISGREGQLFTIAFEDSVSPTGASGNAPYRLIVTLEKTFVPIIIRPDGTTLRYNINLVAKYRLLERSSAKEITAGSLRYLNGYNVPDSDFSGFVSQEDAIKRGIGELAESLRLRLIGYFGAQPPS